MNTDETRSNRPLHVFMILGIALLLIGLWAWLTLAPPSGDGETPGSVGIAGSSADTGGGSRDAGQSPGQAETPNPAVAPAPAPAPAPETPPPETPPTETAPPEPPVQEEQVLDESTDIGNIPLEELQKKALIQSLSEITPAAPETKKTADGKTSGRRGFYGIDVKEDGKVLFLVDVSGSMDQFSEEMLDRTRLGILKMELVKSICGGTILPTAQTFQRKGGFIITRFSSTANSYPENGICRYRNISEVKDALLHIANIPAGGGTNMIPAWCVALDRVEKDKIEAVYFLTDGEPGDGFTAETLEEMLKERKISKKLVIHCIAIGGDRPLLKTIANAHYGKYVFIP